MKKIIVNGRFFTQRTTGVQRYAREILNELDKIVDPEKIEVAVPRNVPIENVPKYKNIKINMIGNLHDIMWEHVSFPLYVLQKRGISLNLCNVAPLFAPGIVCIHDMKIKAHPEFFNKKFVTWYNILFKNEILRAKALITVSEFSKKEICKYYKVKAEKITVIPNSWQHYNRIGYDEDALKKYGLNKKKYYFSMCSLEPNKNFQWIATAAENNPNYTFAIAGAINNKVFEQGFNCSCPNNLKLLGYVSDQEAKELLKDCFAFIFPSFYEGFGIPPLEAISAGADRVIVSDIPQMHEMFGNEVIYVDPYELPGKLICKKRCNSKAILNRFSWEESAKKMLRVIYSIDED